MIGISDESIVVSQPVEQEMELAEDETGSETGGSLHYTLEQPGQPRESTGQTAELLVF